MDTRPKPQKQSAVASKQYSTPWRSLGFLGALLAAVVAGFITNAFWIDDSGADYGFIILATVPAGYAIGGTLVTVTAAITQYQKGSNGHGNRIVQAAVGFLGPPLVLGGAILLRGLG